MKNRKQAACRCHYKLHCVYPEAYSCKQLSADMWVTLIVYLPNHQDKFKSLSICKIFSLQAFLQLLEQNHVN